MAQESRVIKQRKTLTGSLCFTRRKMFNEKTNINKNHRKWAKHPGTVAVPNIWGDELGKLLEPRSL